MKPYAEMTKEELVALRKDLKAKYHDFQTKRRSAGSVHGHDGRAQQ